MGDGDDAVKMGTRTCSCVCFLGAISICLTLSIMYMKMGSRADIYNAEATS